MIAEANMELDARESLSSTRTRPSRMESKLELFEFDSLVNILGLNSQEAKTACVLIDLCSGVLEPWMPQVISKIELAMELLEDLLGVVQGGQHPSIHARSAILYFILALLGYVDDLMAKFKEVKHSILFLIEILERFLQPVFSLSQPMIDLRNVSELFLMSEEHTCAVALNVIRAAVRKPSILPYLELEWRRGSVPPSRGWHSLSYEAWPV